jgi:DNA-directed RNA polymerase subunit RPC12/RpoP
MARHLEDADDWDDGCNCGGCGNCGSDSWHDDEADSEDSSTIPCPYCGQEFYEDSPRCPHCGHYITDEDAPPRRAPWWIILGVVLCLCAIAVWILR